VIEGIGSPFFRVEWEALSSDVPTFDEVEGRSGGDHDPKEADDEYGDQFPDRPESDWLDPYRARWWLLDA
jgi:hypothetical protein